MWVDGPTDTLTGAVRSGRKLTMLASGIRDHAAIFWRREHSATPPHRPSAEDKGT